MHPQCCRTTFAGAGLGVVSTGCCCELTHGRYVNNTGIMWERGAKAGARLVFAEHRYYGESMPVPAGAGDSDCRRYLTTEQAIADYAVLIRQLRLNEGAEVVVGFGGSYGGMLGSWMRMRYPDALDFMVAGSAPILSFEGCGYDPGTYNAIVTRDANATGGAAQACAANIEAAWHTIDRLGKTAAGLSLLSSAFRTCAPVTSAAALADWVQAPIAYMAMGNYPCVVTPPVASAHAHAALVITAATTSTQARCLHCCCCCTHCCSTHHHVPSRYASPVAVGSPAPFYSASCVIAPRTCLCRRC